MFRRLLAPALALCILPACYDVRGSGEDDDGDDDDAVGDDDDSSGPGDDDDTAPHVGLNCLPAVQDVSITMGTPTQVQLSAEVLDEDGNSSPPEFPAWVVLNGFGGFVDNNGLYTTPADHGGVARIQVTDGDVSDVCEVRITAEGEENLTGDANVPGGFDQASVSTDPGCAPELVYPLNGAVMPGSMVPPLFQWLPGSGGSLYVLELVADYTTLTVFTNETTWQPTESQWDGLTTFDPGSAVSVTLSAGTWNGSNFVGNLCTDGVDFSVEVSDFTIAGSVFYWATSSGGIKRIDIGSLQSVAVPLNSGGGGIGMCHGCHATNLRNPGRMSVVNMGFGGGGLNPVEVYDINTGTPVATPAGQSGLYGALDNTGDRMVRNSLFGGLVLDNPTTNQQVGTVPTQGASAFPNWSPDNALLAYSSCGSTDSSGASQMSALGCSLRTLAWSGNDSWGTDTEILASDGIENFYYPTFSPDSEWIAYNRASEGDSYDNPLAELWLIKKDGSLNHRLDAANGGEGLTTSWPRWSPSVGDYAWLAFSSKRAYGTQQAEGGPSQIWISAIDLAAAANGEDASSPPMWLPGQGLGEGNHTPTWVPRYTN